VSPGDPNTRRSSLLALGSAVVIAVYSAGYARTRDAAAAFSDDNEPRRPVPASPPVARGEPTEAVQIAPEPAKAPVVASKSAQGPLAVSSAPTKGADHRAASDSAKAASTIAPATPVPVDTAAKQAPTTPSEPPAGWTPPDTSIHPPDTTTVQPDTARIAYRDGKYIGYGTSRHGDIEAAVEIKNGRIAAAYITQCLTRYSCS
jgi:hypothetical protein